MLGVGVPYVAGRESWPETVRAYFGSGQAEIATFFESPTQSEIGAFEQGSMTIGVVVPSPNLLIVAVRYGDLPWVDMPFEAHRVEEAGRGVPVGAPDEPLAVRSVLVDAATGLVEALRIDELDVSTSRCLRDRVGQQLEHPYEPEEAERVLDEVRQAFASPEQLVREHAEVISVTTLVAGGAAPLSIHHY